VGTQIQNQILERDLSAHLLPPRIERSLPNSRATYPLSFLHSNNYVTKRIALIG
jgi:2-polyprenyl-6-methoxyphenol hydroxylase-like FAD-dependent oxidoreductase